MIQKVVPLRFLQNTEDASNLYDKCMMTNYTKLDVIVNTELSKYKVHDVLEPNYGGKLYNRSTGRHRSIIPDKKYIVVPHDTFRYLFPGVYYSRLSKDQYNKLIKETTMPVMALN